MCLCSITSTSFSIPKKMCFTYSCAIQVHCNAVLGIKSSSSLLYHHYHHILVVVLWNGEKMPVSDCSRCDLTSSSSTNTKKPFFLIFFLLENSFLNASCIHLHFLRCLRNQHTATTSITFSHQHHQSFSLFLVLLKSFFRNLFITLLTSQCTTTSVFTEPTSVLFYKNLREA